VVSEHESVVESCPPALCFEPRVKKRAGSDGALEPISFSAFVHALSHHSANAELPRPNSLLPATTPAATSLLLLVTRLARHVSEKISLGWGEGAWQRLACELADVFSGVAAQAGMVADESDTLVSPCTPSRPVNVLQYHGTAVRVHPV
jgi:hypothetical protein